MDLSIIPKDLPKKNPLLFSFLMILDALKMNVRFNGKYSRPTDKLLPAFEYAVNTWDVLGLDAGAEAQQPTQISMDVVAALWKNRPDENDCSVTWSKFPNLEEVKEKPFSVDYFYDFEEWRNETFDELESIISYLVAKGAKRNPTTKEINYYLADMFGWKIEGRVTFMYAVNSTANQFYGVGAKFTLIGDYSNCCPRIDDNLITKSYFESVGFVFE